MYGYLRAIEELAAANPARPYTICVHTALRLTM